MQIRAAIARAKEPFKIETVDLGPPGAGEVLVKVEACGMCHTDLAAKDHGMGTPLPAVLGHEGVGHIEALGPGVTGFAVGERVLMSFGACNECSSCKARMPAYCRHVVAFNLLGRRLDGSSPIALDGSPITGHFFGQSAFATHAVASTTNLVKLDEDLPAAMMAPLACGLQTGVSSVVNVLGPGPEDAVGIFGCGTVGLGAVMAARLSGAKRIVAVDIDDARLALARELGATHALLGGSVDPAPEISKLGGLTRAFDTTGIPAVIEGAFALLRPRGVLVCAGVSPRGAKIAIDPNLLMSTGRTIRGTVEGDADPRAFIPRMIDWYRRGELPVEKLVKTYELDRIDEAARDMVSRRCVKPVLLM